MEDNRSGHISEKELDGLLNEAFLNLDFESNSKNKEVLAIVAKQAMRKNSLFSFFNLRRLNLLFLLLSLSICVKSSYRCIEALPGKENKKTGYAGQTRAPEQEKPLVILPAPGDSKKGKGEYPCENRSVLSGVVTFHPAKRKFETGNKKNDQTILSAALSKTHPTDSASTFTGSVPEIRNTDPLLNTTVADSLSNVPQKTLQISAPKSGSAETKPSKKLKPLKPATKVKVAKRRKKFFNRPAKVRKKGSRFLKDSGRR